MTLIEKIQTQYANARADLQATINRSPLEQGAHARYDYKKALRKHPGRKPKKQTAAMERMVHELSIEERYKLEGIMLVRDLIEPYTQAMFHDEHVVAMAQRLLSEIGNLPEEV